MLELLIETLKELESRSLLHTLRKLRDYREAIFAQAPFRDGDRVVVRKNYPNEGFSCDAHHLKPGSTGEVHDVDWEKGKGWVCSFWPDTKPNHGFGGFLGKHLRKLAE